ncbi:atp synthase f1 gamma [Phaffia rhodozyma]|uniref:ATP synthase subunit gamma n=1 Tax=Phaffia rhodozyma TaxID=264483 RepID=A0A0F7SJ90_PHARH|nr:atp synthase f1 gamma [Phaffia rhodozyma]
MSFSTRTLRPVVKNLVQARPAPVQVRNMATLREIEMRLKSVKNIEKITNSMKVIASTRLAKATRAMGTAQKYGAANNELFNNAEAKSEGGKVLLVAISSDSGLCGGIHSSITKATKRAVAANPDAKIVVLGDRPKAQLSRAFPEKLELSFSAVGKDIPTFATASQVADEILNAGIEFDEIHLIYNKFISAIAYEAETIKILSEKALKDGAGFTKYEMEEEVTDDQVKFALANGIYAALVEGHAAEISARRTAMENASKNAKDMMGSLQMQYNRGRQAVITNELIDIITGASAL